MHLTIHPSQWFHHETAPVAEHKLRELLHDGAFWGIVILVTLILAMFVFSILVGGPNQLSPDLPIFLP